MELARWILLCSLQNSVLLQEKGKLVFFRLDSLHVFQGERISALEIICFHKS